jgi:hypothetical protein
MALPTTRDEFKIYVLRRLGAPVIEINVDDDQLDDRIDDALKYYYDYHFDGTEKIYYKHQVTSQDKANKYITLPENIIGAIRIFSPSTMSSSGMFSVQYQIALNDLYTLTSQSLVPFYMTMQHLQLLEQLLVGEKPIRYNRHRNQLHVDMNWDIIDEGKWILVEAYQIVDPETYPDVWSDRWLLRYATAMVARQWGQNLSKFVGMQLPGGIQFNGERILSDAQSELAMLESEMINSYSLPIHDMMG